MEQLMEQVLEHATYGRTFGRCGRKPPLVAQRSILRVCDKDQVKIPRSVKSLYALVRPMCNRPETRGDGTGI